MRRNPALDVSEESQTRRRARDLRHVHQVEPAPIDLRGIHRGGRLSKSSIEPRSLKLGAPRIASNGDYRKSFTHPAVSK